MDISPTILTTVVIFMLTNLVATVWWASRITGMVDNLKTIVEKLATVIDDHTKNLYTKSEAMMDLKKTEESIAKMWERIDECRNSISAIKSKCEFLTEKVHKNG